MSSCCGVDTNCSPGRVGAGAGVVCEHCRKPIEISRACERDDSGHIFCCQGCRNAFELIRSKGMGRFYQLRERTGCSKGDPAFSEMAFTEFDNAAFLDRHAPDSGEGVRSTEFYLEGLHCAACVWLIEKLPDIVPGIHGARVNLSKALVRITWDGQAVQLSEIARTLNSLGYRPHPARDTTSREAQRREERAYLINIAAAGAIAGNLMVIAVAMYAGLLSDIASHHDRMFRIGSMILGVIALVWPGRVFFRGAWAALKTRTPHMDLPVALGLGIGGLSGTVNTILDRGDVYFDSLGMLIFLLLIGRFVQYKQQRRAENAIELLYSLTPNTCRRIVNSEIEEVPLEAVHPGDLLEVRAGESIPADGLVTEGHSSLDQAILTGESNPTSVHVGDPVFAGTTNLAARICMRVDAAGMETRAGKLMALVEDSLRTKAPFVQLADRIAGVFVLSVLALAAGTYLFWLQRAPGDAVDHTIALLIVACPCALGLATPLSIAVAIGRAAKKRILIKGGNSLEVMARGGTIFLDKTGTITTGTMTLKRWYGEEGLKPAVFAIESHSMHPIAQAICRGIVTDTELVAEDVAQESDGGIRGRVNGNEMRIGSRGYLQRSGILVSRWAEEAGREIVCAGSTPIFIEKAGKVHAVASVGDVIRDDAFDVVKELGQGGWKVGILSGDHSDIVKSVAHTLQISDQLAFGDLTPEQKADIVNKEKENNTVIMVGDGVNDAAALAEADTGIAVESGAEASLTAANVYLQRPGLQPILRLLEGCSRTVVVIKRTLGFSLIYNIATVSLAAAGMISPLVAALLMPFSSISVLTIALSSRTFNQLS